MGLITAHNFEISTKGLLVVFLPVSIIFFCSLVLRKKGIATLTALLLLWGAGVFSLVPYRTPIPTSGNILSFADGSRINIEGIIDTGPMETHDRTRIFLQTTYVHTPAASYRVTGRIRLSILETHREFRYGDRIRFFCRLTPPRNFENPGRFDYVRYLAYRSVFATAVLSDDRGIIKIGHAEGNAVFLLMEGYRDKVRAAIDGCLPSPERDVLKALVLGEKNTLAEPVKERFAALGISHLLAISGLHVGIVALVTYALVMAVLKLFYKILLYVDAGRLAVLVSIVPVLFYCFIAGFHLPTIRAFIMMLTYVLGLLLGRPEDLLSTVFLAAFVILLCMPPALFDISFQLSFTAVISLIIIIPALRPLFFVTSDRLVSDQEGSISGRAYRVVIGLFLASTAAILGTLPLQALAFNRFSFMGFFANMLFVPFVGFLIVPAGLLATLFLPVCSPLSFLFYKATGLLIHQLLLVVSFWSGVETGQMHVVAPAVPEIVLYYAALLSGVFFLTRQQFRNALLAVACCIVLGFSFGLYQQRGIDLLRVTFLDVGKGDAALVEFPGKETMLIDGGGFFDDSFDVGQAIIAPVLYKRGIKKIDYVVLSHPHKDHMGGLSYIIRNFCIGEIWMTGAGSDDLAYKRLMTAVQEKGITKKFCSRKTPPVFAGDAEVRVISPGAVQSLREITSYYGTNNNSLVIKITYGTISFLFTGDILGEAEQSLVRSESCLASTIIKVPHHGREGSSTQEFVQNVSPEIAVISCRARGGGVSPSPRVLGEYRRVGARVYRTDTDGAIMIDTDGEQFSVTPYYAR